jgi:hypothetical protein
MAEIWGLVAAGAAIVGSAVISSNASSNAASTAANAANQGTNAQLSMFNTTQSNFKPQIQLGQGAANMLGSIYGIGGVSGGKTTTGSPNANYSNFYNSPGYQFSLQQGENAINKSAAASGGLYSTNTTAALGNYAAGAASTQYNSYINQLLSMAGLGNAAASGVGTAATATGQGVANTLQNAGNASAAGQLGSANAFTNALGMLNNNNGLLGALMGGGQPPSTPSGYNTGGTIGGYSSPLGGYIT